MTLREVAHVPVGLALVRDERQRQLRIVAGHVVFALGLVGDSPPDGGFERPRRRIGTADSTESAPGDDQADHTGHEHKLEGTHR